MNKISKSEKGFSVVEILMLLVAIALIVLVGYMVYKDHHKTVTLSTTTISTNKTFSDSAAQASFTYPSTWTLASIRGLCDEPNGCTPSSDHINAVELTSPDKSINLIWSGIGGVGGYCDNTIPPTQSGGCTIETVFSSTPLSKIAGLYVVEGAMEISSGQYQPFLAIQDKTGLLTSGERGLWYQSFDLPSTGISTLFYMDNSYKDGGGGTSAQTFSSLSQVQTYLNTPFLIQAKQLLSSLQVK